MRERDHISVASDQEENQKENTVQTDCLFFYYTERREKREAREEKESERKER